MTKATRLGSARLARRSRFAAGEIAHGAQNNRVGVHERAQSKPLRPLVALLARLLHHERATSRSALEIKSSRHSWDWQTGASQNRCDADKLIKMVALPPLAPPPLLLLLRPPSKRSRRLAQPSGQHGARAGRPRRQLECLSATFHQQNNRAKRREEEKFFQPKLILEHQVAI